MGTGTFGRVCVVIDIQRHYQRQRIARQASTESTTVSGNELVDATGSGDGATTLQSGTTLPTVLPTATLPQPVTTAATTTQPFDIIEMCTVEGHGAYANCLVSH